MRRWITRILLWSVLTILVPSAVLLVALPGTWNRYETIEVNADPDTIHEWVRDMKHWPKWTGFADQVPGTEFATYGSTRSPGSGISLLRPLTSAFAQNPEDPATIAEEEKAREAWRNRQTELQSKVSELRGQSRDQLDKAFDLRKKAGEHSSSRRQAAERALNAAAAPEYRKALAGALELLNQHRQSVEWAGYAIESVERAMASETDTDPAAAVLELTDRIRRTKGAPDWLEDLGRNLRQVQQEYGAFGFVREIRELVEIESERKRVTRTRELAAEFTEAAATVPHGAAMKEAAEALRDAADSMDTALDEIASLRASAKQAEEEAEAIDTVRRREWFDREIASVTLLVAQKRQVGPQAQRLLVALEQAHMDELTRTQYLDAINEAGIPEADADAARIELAEAGLVRVIARPDLLRIHPAAAREAQGADECSLLVQLGHHWGKEVSAGSWKRTSLFTLTEAEAETGMKELLASGMVHYEQGKDSYVFQDLRQLDPPAAPHLGGLAFRSMVVLLGVDDRTQPLAKFTELIAPALGRERMDAALKKLMDAGVLTIQQGKVEERTELTRREGTGFRMVYGENSRMQATFQVTYRGREDGTTVVTWRGTGEYKLNPIHRLVGFFSHDDVGEIMRAGLARLKQAAESGKP